MLHNKMINLLWIFWCCTSYESVEARKIVSNTVSVQTFFNNGTLYVEGSSVESSYIKSLTTNRTILKMYVYIADTFYVNEDLQLNGIEELQIFAPIWKVEHPVTFDLSGWNGTNNEPTTIIKGSAGNSGNSGMNGGSFFGLAKIFLNLEYLTVISNGGNGGDGQDGTATDDTYALFSGNDGDGESGWFSQVDLHKYYEKYFGDKGYDVEISDIDDFTSLYAVFAHNKKASFNIRLHPRKCCGTTGIGGAGGTGGRNGTLIFKDIRNYYNSVEETPNFIANNGTAGKLGKDAKTCETFALDVRADTELKKIVFFYPPLHQSFTNHFTVLNHTNSSKCSPEYVRSKQPVDSKPVEIKTDASINRYKKFLLENIKNESLTTIILETYKAIDENWQINKGYSLEALILEWYELEKNCLELKKSKDGLLMYSRLFMKISRIKSLLFRGSHEDEEALYCLKSLLSYKLTNLQEHRDLILDLKLYIRDAVREIEIRNNQLPELNVSDVAVVNHYYQLMLLVKGNDALAIYHHAIDGFKLAYFPFAVKYLEMYELSTSFLDYIDLNDILKDIEIALYHTGQSAIRCNNNFYEMTNDPVVITSSFLNKLRDNRALLSPYALWEIQISAIDLTRRKLNKLKRYGKSVDFRFDMELHGTGEFIREDESICESENLAKFYSQMKN